MPSAPIDYRPFRRRLAVALAVLAGALAVALAGGPRTSAQTARLDQVRAEQDQVRAELAEQNAAVDALLGQVSALRQREDAVAAELADQEAKLAAARSDLAAARDALAKTKRRLKGALDELERLLVSIYRNGQPDAATLLLDSENVDDLTTRTLYLDRLQDYQSGVVGRVRSLRAAASAHVDEVETSVARMEDARAAIADRQRALASSRASLEQRESALRAAQERRRAQLSDLQGEAQTLVKALSEPAPEPEPAAGSTGTAATGDTSAAPAANVAPPSASQATLNADGTATAPADAPEAVKGAIAAANSITNAPYVYGGGHGSFESSGYDCSGSVSFALHGGGLLSAPLDSTGFMTWGESGPGNWITVYSNPGHAYMVIAGLRFDTSGAPPRWQGPRDSTGFVATHPPGY
jgi:septal ring factor EnvC (AmiA/AmiB activator)